VASTSLTFSLQFKETLEYMTTNSLTTMSNVQLQISSCLSILQAKFAFWSLQATEDYMVHLFEDTNLCAIHAKCVTISEALISIFPSLSG
jgi:hypothetical protein